MVKKKRIEEEVVVDLPEYGFKAKDEDGAILIVKSNAGKDKGLYLENAKKFKRPICFTIEGEIFDTYKFKSFAMTKEEARGFVREVNRMLDYLDEV